MAAITYWVRADGSGSDANSGSSYADALATHAGAATKIIADGDGNDYTINFVNDGTHTWDIGLSQIDNQPNSTFLIRGTNSSGDPALTTVTPTASVNSSTEAFFYIRENSGITVEYLEFDCTPSQASRTIIFNRDPSTGTIEFRYCSFLVQNWAARTSAVLLRMADRDFNTQMGLWVHHCYWQGGHSSWYDGHSNTSGVNTRFTNNVVVDWISNSETSLGPLLWVTGFNTSEDSPEVSNNTYYLLDEETSSTIPSPAILFSDFSGDAGGFTLKNNVFFIDNVGTGAPTISTSSGFVRGSSDSATSTFDGSEDIGHNMFYLGSGYDSATPANMANYRNNPWEPGVDDLYPGDVRRNGQSAATVFANPSSSYDWTPAGSAVAITLPVDLRLSIDATAGEGGTTPGALPAASTSYTLSIVADNSAPDEGQDVDLTITVESAGDADAEVDVTIPVGLTVTASTPSAGSYAAGTWTVTLTGGSPETLVLTADPDAGTGGTALQVDVEVSSASSPGPATPTSDSVILNVNKKTDFTVQATTTRPAVYPGEALTLRAAVSNDAGGFESDAVFDITLPSFVSVVSATPSAGTYDSGTGQWTITLAAGAAATLTFSVLVSLTASPESGTFEAAVNAASDPPPGGSLADDTDSVSVQVLEVDVSDPEQPAAAPFLDVAPLNTSELLLDLNMAVQSKQNRVRKHYKRADVEGQRWREANLRRIEIGPDTTTQLNLGGIERGQFVILESSTQVDVSIGNGTDLYVPAKVVVLSDGEFTNLYVRNNSTTVTATVLYGVTD